MTCIVRYPLLDPKKRILGYKLAWQPAREGAHVPGLAALAACVARRPREGQAAWAAGSLLFLEAPPGPLAPESLSGLASANTVISLSAAELADPAVLDAVGTLREQGVGLAVRDLPSLEVPEELASLVTHVEFDWGRAARARALPPPGLGGRPQPRLIASGLASWDEYQASVTLGVDAFVSGTHAAPTRTDGTLSPRSLLILQLMQMVQSNVDVRHIESTLRRDAALAYELLKYLNSASFGFGVEVQSLRHAVTMMGYGPLYRWLAVLLAGSSAQPASPVLMQAAVVRGRFAELLGQGMLPRREAENLFVAGMFSLLDRLLGVPVKEILERIHVPEAVVQALLTREGMYGPFVSVAEACELPDGRAAAVAESVFLTSAQTNAAHVAALAWALDLRT